MGVPVVGQRKNFAIINLATGYYLTVSEDNKTIVALSPETVERGPRTKRQASQGDGVGSPFTNIHL